MAKSIKDVLKLIEDNGIMMVDFKMVDINGQFRHVTIPAENFSEDTMKSGIGFDASNYGYAVVEKSDMVFIPDPDTAVIDPFCDIPTLSMTGTAMIIDNPENRPLAQYPRNVIKAAVEPMKKSGVADTMYILPEFEFYLFDQVGWNVSSREISASVDAHQSYWNSATEGKGANLPGLTVGVIEARGEKCPRCWMHSLLANAEGLCPRCAVVVSKLEIEE